MCVSCKDKEMMGGSGQRSRLLYKNIVASIAIKGYAAIISLMLVPLTLNCLGTLQEMVVNKRHGFLVQPKDTKELENAIRKIIQPEIGKQMSDFIQKDYSSREYSWQEMSAKVLDIYNAILQKKH